MSELLTRFEAAHADKTAPDDAASGSDQSAAGWPSLPDRVRTLPVFPVDALPDDLSAFCAAVAEAWQVPPDMAVAFALGVASAAIVGRVSVQPKRREPDYLEPAQVFILCQGASGERKTPCLRYLARPLEDILEGRRILAQEENAGIDRELKALEQIVKRAKGQQDVMALEDQRVEIMARRMTEPESLQADVTPESVALGMSEHDGRAVILADEADFLNVLAGRSYSRDGAAVNLGVILSGYNNAPFHGRRVTRGEWHIPRAALSICLGCQPGLLQDFMRDAAGVDRGLHARFLYFLPRSMIGSRKAEGKPVPPALAAWWTAAVSRLAESKNVVLPFDPMAEAEYRNYFDDVERRLPADLGGPLQAWAGKICGNAVRLAGLLALLAGEDQVRRSTWDAAAYIAEKYLIPHARAAFGGIDTRLSDHARMLLPRLRELDQFQQSDFWKAKGRYILGKENVEPYRAAIDVLAQWGYIRKAATQPNYSGTGRLPSPVWDVHPDLRARSAETVSEVEL